MNIGLGSKPDHPILQAADMLAYSEWQKMSGGDPTIYDALHASDITYSPEFVDFDAEMVDVITKGAEKWMADRKAWGQRKPRQIERGVNEQSVHGVRRDDGEVTESSAQRDQGQAERGKLV